MNNNQPKQRLIVEAAAISSLTSENANLKLDLAKAQENLERVARILGEVKVKLDESGLQKDFRFNLGFILRNYKRIGALIEAIVFILRNVR